MTSKELKEWVSDQLYSILGFAERNVVDFVISAARAQKTSTSLASFLQQSGDLPANPQTLQFAQELLNKLPSKQTGSSAYQQQQKQARSILKKSLNYGLLEDDAQLDSMAAPPLPAATKPSSDVPSASGIGSSHNQAANNSKNRHLRSRKDASEDAADDTVVRRHEREKRRWEKDEEGDNEREAKRRELERERDQREKEEFEKRLRAKDDARTSKKVDEDGLTKAERKEAERRRYSTEDQRKALLPTLRDVSRQEYLRKREEKKLQELEDELKDAQYLFGDVELTQQEKLDLAYKEKVYRLAMEKKQQLEAIHEDGYRLPESYDDPAKRLDRYAAAHQRYREPDEEEERATPWTEQEKWEGEQIKRTQMMFGAKDNKAEVQYEYLFEDQIEFIKDALLEGNIAEVTAEDMEAAEKKRAVDKKKSERERIMADRASLPIYPYRDELLKAVEEHQIIVIVAETGAGKTTQVPQYLHEAGYSKMGKIGCTQPRRVAAMSVAARVAQEMGVKLGYEVGYSIRFEDCTSDKTILKYMTDGMLLREFLGEPDLASYSVMMIDEAHERTLHTDVLFGLVKDIARFRPDLKLLISSATLDAEKFSDYFDHAPIFKVPGRRYPVDIMYTKAPEADYIDAAIVTVLQVHATQPPGDILVFLTGQEEIEAMEELLKQRTRGLGSRIGEMLICPIYANLPTELQAKIFEPTPPGARKVVLATNIAETSLTIDGITFVIDPGFCKMNSYNPRSGMESLIITPVSKASAQQRAGRAGRTAPGKCFRLFTAWSFMNELDDNTVPEIQRTNLSNVVLMLKSLGIHDLVHFDFMDPPPAECLLRALEQLYALGALNDKGELTKLGRRMAEFPLDPMLSKTLIASETYGVSEEIATICSMVSVGSAVFYRPKDKAVHADNAHKNFSRGNVGDHIALLNVFDSWAETNFSSQWCFENYVQLRSMKRARDIRDQLVGLMERVEVEMASDNGNHDGMKKALASGFFYHTARLQRDGSYRTVKQPTSVHIHPGSSLVEVLPKWVVYHELVLTSKEYMRTVSEIKPDWLVEIAPHYYSKKDIADDGKKLPKGKGRAQMDRV